MAQIVDLHDIELMPFASEIDHTRRVRATFPISSATGTAASCAVYFELDPGTHVGVHTDSSEEFIIVLEGEGLALLGEDTAPVREGQVLVVPAMERHDVTNTGTTPLRVLGTFAGSTSIATFEEDMAPGGPRVFVIGGPMPIVLPLDQEVPSPAL
jgi:mannose-6-phosphate isomerase-like protein (cupin superfamily)